MIGGLQCLFTHMAQRYGNGKWVEMEELLVLNDEKQSKAHICKMEIVRNNNNNFSKDSTNLSGDVIRQIL